MNHNALKYVIVFSAGVGVGFFVAKKMFEEKYSWVDNGPTTGEDIESTCETPADQYKRRERDEGERIKPKSSLEGTYTNEYNHIKRNYGLVVDDDYLEKKRSERESPQDDDPDSDEHTDEDLIEAEMSYNNDKVLWNDKPYIIEDSEFADEMPHYDKITLYYYVIDEVLVDDGEDIIPNVEDIIGGNFLDIVQSNTGPDTIWVRNDRLASDYEVVILYQSYQEAVMGITPRGNGDNDE